MATDLYKALGLIFLALALTACGAGRDEPPPVNLADAPTSEEPLAGGEPPADEEPPTDDEPNVGAQGDWELVWNDQFDGDAINTDYWSYETNCAGGGNNELQCYTDRPENSFVENGNLVIVAREETFSGPALFDDDPNFDPNDTSVTKDFTSARLRTKNKADWRYGRIEVSAKLPEGQGMWPAIWMLPTENVHGGWPLSGEIDIFEAVNTNAEGGNEVFGTLHYGREWPNNVFSGAEFTPQKPIWENFHTYAIEWEEGEIRWFVDDNHYATQRADGWFTFSWQGQDEGFSLGDGAAPFDELFHLILNVAVGGNFPGAPNDETSFPQRMEVDYVRVFECSEDPQTGKGCATSINESVLVEGNGGQVNEFTLYENGPATLTFDVFDAEVTNTLAPASFQAADGNLVSEASMDLSDQVVWEAMFNGQSNIFLLSEDMVDVAHVDTGFAFDLDPATSAINFDMRIIAAEESTDFVVKLDSFWPNVSEQTIVKPEVGEWVNVSVRLSDLQPNSVEPGEVDLSNINSPFVLEPVDGTAEIQLNNISISCFGDSCGVEPKLDGTVPDGAESTLDVFVGGRLVEPWNNPGVDFFDDPGQVITQALVADPDSSDNVLEITFSNDNFGTMFIQAEDAQDLNEFSAGELVFDLKVVDPAQNSGGFLVKADCIFPCTSKEIPVAMPDDDSWTTVRVPISELTQGTGFRFATVNVPFSFWPIDGEQENVTFRLDNIRWVLE